MALLIVIIAKFPALGNTSSTHSVASPAFVKWTFLHYAVRMDDITMVRGLLQKGVNPNAVCQEDCYHCMQRYTPLTLAMRNQSLETVQLLLEHGADPILVWGSASD